MSFVQNKGFIIADFKLGTVFCVNYCLEKFVSSVEIVNLKVENKTFWFLLGDKKGNFICVRHADNQFSSFIYDELHTALISEIKANPNYKFDKGLTIATGSYDRTIKISLIKNSSGNFTYKNLNVMFVFKHSFRISGIDWDPFNPHRFLNSCQKHVTV